MNTAQINMNSRYYIIIVSKIQSTLHSPKDWVHQEYIYQTEDEARRSLVNMAQDASAVQGCCVDMFDVEYQYQDVYLVYQFSENYCKDFITFTNYQCAVDYFHNRCDEQDNVLDNDHVRVVSKEGNKLTSTMYEYDMFDKRNVLIFSDSEDCQDVGKRWVLVNLKI